MAKRKRGTEEPEVGREVDPGETVYEEGPTTVPPKEADSTRETRVENEDGIPLSLLDTELHVLFSPDPLVTRVSTSILWAQSPQWKTASESKALPLDTGDAGRMRVFALTPLADVPPASYHFLLRRLMAERLLPNHRLQDMWIGDHEGRGHETWSVEEMRLFWCGVLQLDRHLQLRDSIFRSVLFDFLAHDLDDVPLATDLAVQFGLDLTTAQTRLILNHSVPAGSFCRPPLLRAAPHLYKNVSRDWKEPETLVSWMCQDLLTLQDESIVDEFVRVVCHDLTFLRLEETYVRHVLTPLALGYPATIGRVFAPRIVSSDLYAKTSAKRSRQVTIAAQQQVSWFMGIPLQITLADNFRTFLNNRRPIEVTVLGVDGKPQVWPTFPDGHDERIGLWDGVLSNPETRTLMGSFVDGPNSFRHLNMCTTNLCVTFYHADS